METIRNLPAPLRFGLPVGVVLLLGLVIWMTVLREPAPVELVKTRDLSMYDTAKSVLDGQHIDYDVEQTNGTFSVLVPAGDATKAAEALAASGIKDRTGLAKSIECPPAPGFTATKAANMRSDNCEDAKAVQGMLITAGALAANVRVSQMENSTFLGPEMSKNVVAQVFLPSSMKDDWAADEAARAIASSIGTTIDRVSITDDRLQLLFDGATSAGSSSSSSTGSSSGDCSGIQTATEVATKEAAVRSCYEATISDKLEAMLGGSDRFVLGVQATIDSTARTTTTTTSRKGTVLAESTNTGRGSKATDRQNQPTTSTGTKLDPAGDISKLAITVALDANTVNARQELAVKRLLSTYIEPSRKDPAPTVTRYAFPSGTGEKPKNEDLEAIAAAARKSSDPAETLPRVTTRTQTPTWMYAVLAVVVIGMLTAIAVLWRRSATIAAERAQLESEFRDGQRLFEDFAQQNPDDIARDLETLFGAPSAHR